jgi:hypothetical protein
MTQATQAAPSIDTVAGRNRLGALGVASLVVAYVSLWLVTGRYWGLEHDAQLYAVQALAKLNPAVLPGDLFLRFQSQDEYTLFPYVCAAAIRWLGLDHGAAMLTAAMTLGWYWAAWHFARRLVGVRQAWLAVGLLFAIPGWYGAGHVFRTAEPFLSARPAAEALCLAALALVLGGHRVVTVLVIGVAFLVHPIMAMPGALVCVAIVIHERWSQRTYGWPFISIVAGLVIIAGATLLGGSGALMTDPWLADVRHRSDFLFPTGWSVADRQTAVVPLLTTLLAARYLTGQARMVALASFWVGATGLMLAVLADAAVPLTVIVQGQPWRWIWPSAVVAVVLLPATVLAAWYRGGVDRAAVMLCCSCWVLLQWSSAEELQPIGVAGLLICLACILSYLRRRPSDRVSRLLVWGAGLSLAGAAVGLSLSVLALVRGRFNLGIDPAPVQFAGDVLAMPVAAALAVIGAWTVTIDRFRRLACISVAAAGAALGTAAAPGAVAAWTTESFGAPERAAFAGFRSIVPTHAEVFWWDGLPETWFLMERRSYLSLSQLGGIVFSEPLAGEARRRGSILAPIVQPGYWFAEQGVARPQRLTRDILSRICVPGGPDFIVSGADLGQALARVEWPTGAKSRYLYACASESARGAPN